MTSCASSGNDAANAQGDTRVDTADVIRPRHGDVTNPTTAVPVKPKPNLLDGSGPCRLKFITILVGSELPGV